MTFSCNTPETKKLAGIFCKAFLVLEKYFAKPSRTYFRFLKDLLIHKQ
jgi:hypothetical protein